MREPKRTISVKRGGQSNTISLLRRRVELLGIRFKSDHGLLTNNDSDWTLRGKRFDTRTYELDDQRPLSQTKNARLRVKLKLYFHGFSGKREVRIIGTGGADHFNFQQTVRIDGQREWPELEADAPLPDSVLRTQIPPILWQVEADGMLYNMGVLRPHDLYVTYGEPIVPPRSERQVEDGVTLKRMQTAMELVAKTDADIPHGIVAGLMENFPFTVLQPDVDREPKKFAPATRFGGP